MTARRMISGLVRKYRKGLRLVIPKSYETAQRRSSPHRSDSAPLGYDRHPDPLRRVLVINPEEARTVQRVFELYDQHGNLRSVENEAHVLGLRSKAHSFASGRRQGGTRLTRGQIHYLLTNPVYLGRIRHKTAVYEGQHPALLETSLWDSVQAKLQAAGARPRGRSLGSADPASVAPLIGKIRDDSGDQLTPSQTRRRGRLHRYYISNRLISGGVDPTAWRLPAAPFERALTALITRHLEAASNGHRLLQRPDATSAAGIAMRADHLVARLHNEGANLLPDLLFSAQLGRGTIRINLQRDALANLLQVAGDDLDADLITFDAPFTLRRRGVETRILSGDPAPAPDPVLVRMLVTAHRWLRALRKGEEIAAIAIREGHAPSYIRTRASLAFLSPKIQAAILAGTQPPDLSLERIVKAGIPLDWAEQDRRFGFT